MIILRQSEVSQWTACAHCCTVFIVYMDLHGFTCCQRQLPTMYISISGPLTSMGMV